jgi:hypothetical protein
VAIVLKAKILLIAFLTFAIGAIINGNLGKLKEPFLQVFITRYILAENSSPFI